MNIQDAPNRTTVNDADFRQGNLGPNSYASRWFTIGNRQDPSHESLGDGPRAGFARLFMKK